MISKKQRKLFGLAQAASKLSDYARIKIGAVIVKNGDVVSVGFNREKTHPIQKKYNVYRGFSNGPKDFIHAEMAAIIKARHLDLRGASIYVSRKAVNGGMAICRPCPACMRAIIKHGIRKVFYTTSEGYQKLILEGV